MMGPRELSPWILVWEEKRYASRLTSRMEPNKLFGDGGSGIRAGETVGGAVLSSFESVVGCERVRTAV
jgi:hypothetical protein